ncbi:MAG: OmpH family outer membrane protein [Bacteroides sp.]|nr:OmpH family outer membrane protein [Bacteroides sp.]
MIKKLILAFLILFPSMAFAQKFGVVDTDAIVRALPEFKEMQASYESAAKKYEDEFANLNEKFNKEYNEFQAMPEDTPNSIRERRAQELQELDQKMQQFRLNAQQELQQTQTRLMQPILERVRTAISSVGQEGNFTLIFENTLPLYIGTDAVDLTSQVRTKLGI